eukprot:scaffold76619_cov28-Tisochrysis_lutea.AAC.2
MGSTVTVHPPGVGVDSQRPPIGGSACSPAAKTRTEHRRGIRLVAIAELSSVSTPINSAELISLLKNLASSGGMEGCRAPATMSDGVAAVPCHCLAASVSGAPIASEARLSRSAMTTGSHPSEERDDDPGRSCPWTWPKLGAAASLRPRRASGDTGSLAMESHWFSRQKMGFSLCAGSPSRPRAAGMSTGVDALARTTGAEDTRGRPSALVLCLCVCNGDPRMPGLRVAWSATRASGGPCTLDGLCGLQLHSSVDCAILMAVAPGCVCER